MDIENILRSNSVSENQERIQSVRQRLFGRRQKIAPEYLHVRHKIGRGTFGDVYLAHDRSRDRPIALKVIRFTEPDERKRLDQEARALARLCHPNIVQLHDSGEVDRGVYFLALEHVDGVCLDEWLEARPRSLDEILEVFLMLAKGLMHAHRRSLVHRDFKPGNVMVGRDGVAKILDFGLAKLTPEGRAQVRRARLELVPSTEDTSALAVDEASDPPTRTRDVEADRGRTGRDPTESWSLDWSLTGSKGFVGTTIYASPEQLETAEVDARSDQFSYFVTLFEAVYGFHPFGRTVGGRRLTRYERLRRIQEGELVQKRAARHVPRWLRALILRGLQPSPDDRNDDLQGLVDALETYLRPPPRRVRHALFGAGIALVAVSAASLVTWQGRERLRWDDPEHWDEGSAWATVEEQLELAYGDALPSQVEELPRRWQAVADDLDEQWLPWRDHAAQHDCLRRSRRAFQREVEVMLEHAGARTEAGLLPPSVHLRSAQLFDPERCRSDSPTTRAPQVAERMLRARELNVRGEDARALVLMDAVRAEVSPLDQPLSGLVDLQRAEILMTMRDPSAWEAAARAAYGVGDDLALQVEALLLQAEIGLMYGREPVQVDELLARAESWEQTLRGRSHATVLARLTVLRLLSEGRRATFRGVHEAAASAYENARAQLEELGHPLTPDDPTAAYLELQTAAALARVEGRRAEARPLIERVLGSLRARLGEHHPLVPLYVLQAANALVHAREIEAARGLFRRTIDRSSRVGGAAELPRLQAEAELLYLDLRYAPGDPSSQPTVVRARARALETAARSLSRERSHDLPGDLARIWNVVALAYDRADAPTRALEVMPEWFASATRDRDRRLACAALEDLRERIVPTSDLDEGDDARFREIFSDLETECS